jgi:hypothetical protein
MNDLAENRLADSARADSFIIFQVSLEPCDYPRAIDRPLIESDDALRSNVWLFAHLVFLTSASQKFCSLLSGRSVAVSATLTRLTYRARK